MKTFEDAFRRANSIMPVIVLDALELRPDPEDDMKYLDRPRCDRYTSGCGSERDPYTYRSASSVSAYYAIISLWFQYRPEMGTAIETFIQVNDWMFKLVSDGVIYKGRHIRLS